ncbi:MAG: GNAT family N-acetyltransferase [Holosporaceae bacterium]|nr:GNAT family N-acetyltransferase [Holosporaceae bacterium]
MKLEGKEVFLTPLSINELSGNYISWLNDQEVCRYNSHGEREYTYADAKNFISSLHGDERKEVYAVYVEADRVHIGNVSLQSIDKKNHSAEVAMLFGEIHYWNKGYATESMKLLIERAKFLQLHRLYFGTHEGNIAMQRLGEKVGFTREGLLRGAQFKDGRYVDVFIYGLII